MRIVETSLPGVVVIEPSVFEDARGFFMETYHRSKYADAGIGCEFIQDNHSCSRRGTLRGLHYQLNRPQAKLCRVIHGEVLDIAVDIRRGSPHFGKWTGVLLSADNKRQVFIPRGFAHGFVVLSETAEFLYKCDDVYSPGDDYGILWNDPAIGVDWGIQDPLLSDKDNRNPALADAPHEQLPRFED